MYKRADVSIFAASFKPRMIASYKPSEECFVIIELLETGINLPTLNRRRKSHAFTQPRFIHYTQVSCFGASTTGRERYKHSRLEPRGTGPSPVSSKFF